MPPSPRAFTGIIGYISVLTGFLVLAFYSVVGGWCVYYMIQAFMGNGIINDPSMMRGAFESFASSDVAPVLSHLTFLGATAFVVYFGVEKGSWPAWAARSGWALPRRRPAWRPFFPARSPAG